MYEIQIEEDHRSSLCVVGIEVGAGLEGDRFESPEPVNFAKPESNKAKMVFDLIFRRHVPASLFTFDVALNAAIKCNVPGKNE